MNDLFWDKKLKIDTEGLDESHADYNHSPYEPTSYEVLFRLVDSGYVQKENILIDYGCGKGRVSFFLSYLTGCRTIGVEYDESIYIQALRNKQNCGIDNVEFKLIPAEKYTVEGADCFYFFNPFSVKILRSVLAEILRSYYASPRLMRLFFYYPTDDYISTLFSKDELICIDEIDCSDLFENDDKSERIVVFEINA